MTATASEWARIKEHAADAGMELSPYIVHRATAPDPLPPVVQRLPMRDLKRRTVGAAARLPGRRADDENAAAPRPAALAGPDRELDRSFGNPDPDMGSGYRLRRTSQAAWYIS